MKRKNPSDPKTRAEWQELADLRLALILKEIRTIPTLNKAGPRLPARKPWCVEVQLVGNIVMSRVNFTYRKKKYPTDVLSFPAPMPFVKQGMLGELIVCLPILKAQAKEMKNPPQYELDVLLVHGVLHLLGFDHERGPKESAVMARWETRLLDRVQAKTKNFQRGLGLIGRTNSGKEST
jgi:rRNA maturation RNase YbeY